MVDKELNSKVHQLFEHSERVMREAIFLMAEIRDLKEELDRNKSIKGRVIEIPFPDWERMEYKK